MCVCKYGKYATHSITLSSLFVVVVVRREESQTDPI
jgi:hypothetical protein